MISIQGYNIAKAKKNALVLRVVLLFIGIFSFGIQLLGQSKDDHSSLTFQGDFRFRLEQDWNSRKSDGTYREDRSRMRYRLRAGVTYTDSWYETGFRMRTGNPIKQQDPQLTLGDGFEEFSTLPIGLEKAYFEGKLRNYQFWLGKNSFPFKKTNELYWSDNVFPEGVFLSKGIALENTILDSLDFRIGHFIISTSNESFASDAYFQGAQIYAELLEGRIQFYPALYILKNIPNIPDGNSFFVQNYGIVHLGSTIHLLEDKKLSLEIEFSRNLESYDSNEFISPAFKNQKNGMVVGLQYNNLRAKKDWFLKLSYAYLEQFAALDYLAQNDWARWDYSSNGSPDGRLTNLKGIEFVAAYQLDNKAVLKMKYYKVNQLLSYGLAKETGDRIRFDIDVRF